MKHKYLFSAFTFALSASSLNTKDLCSGFAPQNDRYIPVTRNNEEASGISEADFNLVLDRVQNLYAPIIEQRGGVFEINRMWTNGTVNASAEQIGEKWVINMYGGLARHELMTADGFLLVACHELGHHLAGKPKYSSYFGGSSWASVEGQSDYFGTTKCLKRVYSSMSDEELTQFKSDDFTAKSHCSKIYSETRDQLICERSAIAGIVLGNVLAELGGQTEVKLETPTEAVYSGIYQYHPKAQCRLDTYFQGSLCSLPFSQDFSNTDQLTGACSTEAGFESGLRPKCWFNPAPTANNFEIESSIKSKEIYY
jgi:hypothetical protein